MYISIYYWAVLRPYTQLRIPIVHDILLGWLVCIETTGGGIKRAGTRSGHQQTARGPPSSSSSLDEIEDEGRYTGAWGGRRHRVRLRLGWPLQLSLGEGEAGAVVVR